MKTVFGPNFKMHIVLSEQNISNLSKDLRTRFGEVFISDDKPLFVHDGCLLWDAGGSIIGNDIKFAFKISDELSLLCRSQHWDLFKKSVIEMMKNKKPGYVKLHSQTFALVMSDDQATKLMSQIIKHSCRLDQVSEGIWTHPA